MTTQEMKDRIAALELQSAQLKAKGHARTPERNAVVAEMNELGERLIARQKLDQMNDPEKRRLLQELQIQGVTTEEVVSVPGAG